ncbi:uncharacterized protein DC041_0010978, partial [Schistosoma bovis]
MPDHNLQIVDVPVISVLFVSTFKDKRSTYPNSYEKYFPLDRSKSFISVHLNQQSIISDPKTGARKSPISQKFTDKSRVQTVKDLFEYGLNNS